MAMPGFLKGVLRKSDKVTVHGKPCAPDERPSRDSVTYFYESATLTSEQSEQSFYDYLFASSHDTPLTVPQKLVIEVVQDNLNQAEKRTNAVPRLPSVIPKLMRSLRDPDSSAKDYVNIVNKDPTISAAVLKFANSVYFNPVGSKIDNIERAVVKLGIEGLRSVLSAAVMQPIIQRESPYFSQTGQRLWQHSLNTAVACEIIGHARRQERFKVYLLGLVHDIGKITLFSELCKQYALNGDKSPSRQAFIPIMRRFSAQLSYIIAKDWQLPEEIIQALAEQCGTMQGKPLSPQGLVLHQANIVCESFAVSAKSERKHLDGLVNDYHLPQNLITKLEEVSLQL